MSTVANQFPSRASTRRLAIVGESPGEHEAREGKPFVGPSGQLLNSFLSHAGIDREACFIGNICQVRPPQNDITKFKWDGPEVQGSIAQLTADLQRYQPHLCLLLGNTALRAFAGEKRSIKDWKGYVWSAREIVPGVKCIGAWHPAAILREMGLQGEEKFYLARAVEELATDTLEMPTRHIEWNLGRDEIIDRLREWRRKGATLAGDIEGGPHTGPACHGFADSSNHAMVVPIYGVDGMSIWSEEDEVMLTEECAAVWEDADVPKIIQNAPYEMTVLAWSLGITIDGLVDDTMCKHAELYAELEKSLEFQAAIYTKQPFWKLHHRFLKAEGRHVPFISSDPSSRRATSEEWFIYNGTDCCVTYECNDAMNKQLKEGQRRHYEWNVKLLACTTYASLRGWCYDKAEADRRLDVCMEQLYEKQDQINKEAATSEERPELLAFYTALGQPSKLEAGPMGAMGERQEVMVKLLPLLTSAFCQARRTERREVEEVSWEPYRWNGKKWVKHGKRQSAIPEGGRTAWIGPLTGEVVWQRHAKKVTRNVPVEITSLEDVQQFTLPSREREAKRALAILRRTLSKDAGAFSLSAAQRGELATLLGIHIKLNATGRGRDKEDESGYTQRGDEKDANWFVYEHCKAPHHFTKERGRNTDRLTSNDSALIDIWLETRDPRIKAFMEWRSLDTRREALMAAADLDGRMRCSYVLPGTETMRLACKKSITGSGYNLQTVTEELRDLFRADPGHEVGKFDLRGADGWTIAAECARMGDETLLLDLRAKVKPVKVIVLLYREGPHINKLTREELLEAQKRVGDDDWDYVAGKPIFYGNCFTPGHELLTKNGWKLIEQVGLGDRIAAYDLHSRRIHFEHPSHMTRQLYTGNLYTFRGHSIDLTVTADHRMPYDTNYNPKCLTAAELYHRKSGRLPTAGQFFRVDGCYTGAFGRLIAAIHSDGCYPKRTKTSLQFCFRKARKIERIQNLLKMEGLEYRVTHWKQNTHIYVKCPQVALYKEWGKEASEKMLCWSKAAMAGYLDEYPHWDGTIDGDNRIIFSVNKQHLDWLDTFAHLSGMNGCAGKPNLSGFGSIVHNLKFNNRTFAEMGSLFEKSVVDAETPQEVYCPTVSTGYIMVRRNGKIAVSGNCYLMGAARMSNSIKEDSYAETGNAIFVSPKQCEALMSTIDLRYPGIKRWQEDEGKRMMVDGRITTSLGWSKAFFGRKTDWVLAGGRKVAKPNRQTHGEWLGTKPQFYTTAATKLAMERVWDDPENRRLDGSLRAELLHTVHDEIDLQWRLEEREFVARKVKSEWFASELLIAGTKLVIPSGATCGPSWGEQLEAL